MNTEVLYLNGKFMPLHEGRVGVEDRGFQLGDGVYEVIKVMNGNLVWLTDHLERLRRSLAAVRLTEALDDHGLESVLPELVDRSKAHDGLVYIQVTRGAAPRDFVFPRPAHPTVLAYAWSTHHPDAAQIMRGAALHPVADQRWARCDIKSTNLLAAVLAKEEAREAGAHEALFIGPDDEVREGGSSNVFALLGGVLRTHPLTNRILGGVTRKHVIEIARRAGYAIEERTFTLSEVIGTAKTECEVFTCSTTKDIQPVVRIGAHAIGSGRPGRVTLDLVDLMRREQAVLVGLQPPPALA
ncbi:MAG: aminotransferase class IV [bacterium]